MNPPNPQTRGLGIDNLAELERSKRSRRAREHWDRWRRARRTEKSGEPYRHLEAAGQQALGFDRESEGG